MLFWSIIETGGVGIDADTQLDAVRERLLEMPAVEVKEFQRWFNKKIADAYTWDLWGAAYLINSGCSPDGFIYFRVWLIGKGEAVYRAALRTPDSLAEVVDPNRDDFESGALWEVAGEVYEELAGTPLPAMQIFQPGEPRGKRWDYEDEGAMAQRFPELGKLYL